MADQYSALADGIWKLGMALLVAPGTIAGMFYLEEIGEYEPFLGQAAAAGVTLTFATAGILLVFGGAQLADSVYTRYWGEPA